MTSATTITFEVKIKTLEGLPRRSILRSPVKRRWYATINAGVVFNRTAATSRAAEGLVEWDETFTITIPTQDRPPARFALYRAHGGSNDEKVAEAADLDLIKISEVKEFTVDIHDVYSKDKSYGHLNIEAQVQLPKVELALAGPNAQPFLAQLCNMTSVPQPWQRFLSAFQQTVELARQISELDPAAKAAIGVISFALAAVMKQIERDQRVCDLREMMTSLLLFFRDIESVQQNSFLRKTLDTTLRQVSECTYFILQYQEIESFVQRTAVHLTSDTDGILAEFFTTFANLKAELALGTSLQTAITTEFILNKVNDIDGSLHIDRLEYLKESCWQANKQCPPLVRDFTLNRIQKWISSFEQGLFILAGPPGSGKSAILHAVAGALDTRKRLGAGIFLTEETRGEKTAKLLMRTIIYYLAKSNPRMAEMIALSERATSYYADAERYGDLLEGIGRNLILFGPLVIIVDGLHELATSQDQKLVEAILMRIATNLPEKLRFIISSRVGGASAALQQVPAYWEIAAPSSLCIPNVNAGSESPATRTSDLVPVTSSDVGLADLLESISLSGYEPQELIPLLCIHSAGNPQWISLVRDFLLAVPPLARMLLDELLSTPTPQSDSEAMQRFSDVRSYLFSILDYDFIQAPPGSRLFISEIKKMPLSKLPHTTLQQLDIFRAQADSRVKGLQEYEINIPPSLPKIYAGQSCCALLPISDSPLNIYQICLRGASEDGQGSVYARIALPVSKPLADRKDIKHEFWRLGCGVGVGAFNEMTANSIPEGCEWIILHWKLFKSETKDGYTSVMAATPVMTQAILEQLVCIWVDWGSNEGACMRLRDGKEDAGFLAQYSFTDTVYHRTHSELFKGGVKIGELQPGDRLQVRAKYEDRYYPWAVIAMALKY